MTRTSKSTTAAVDILHRRYIGTDPERMAGLEAERVNAQAARLVYDLRTQAGLTQKQLAKLVGTTQSVISRLEDADYDGHSLTMLSRISAALNHQLRISVSPGEGLPKRRKGRRGP